MNTLALENQQYNAGRLPDFLVIGAAKSGTSSLHFYLSLHPEIFMSTPKEPRFFVDAAEPMGRWARGLEWYRGLFVTEKRLCGETSAHYSASPAFSSVPARIASLIPSVKVIYLVRNPRDRLVSHYLMYYRGGKARLEFGEFLNRYPHALDSSCYGSQLTAYLEFFSLDQILIVESEKLQNERSSTLRSIFRFLGAAPDFSSPLFYHKRRVSWHEPYLNPLGRRILCTPPFQMLRKILPANLFSLFRNILFRPFSESAPSTILSDELEKQLRRKFANEISVLRQLTGMPLESLDS